MNTLYLFLLVIVKEPVDICILDADYDCIFNQNWKTPKSPY